MYCSKCNYTLSKDAKFCTNCGNKIEANNNIEKVEFVNNSINNNSNMVSKNKNNFGLYSLICGICSIVFCGLIGIILGIVSIFLRKKEYPKTQKGKIGKILGIIGIITSILFLLCFSSLIKTIFEYNTTDENKTTIPTTIKGEYSREFFSGNRFEYITSTDNATFTFNKDSTFEVTYVGGNTYKWTYEIYNGLFISLKASEIKTDTTINNNEELADNIQNVANRMMERNILNTFLLWIKTDDNILQPFVLLYDENTNSADIVNIYAQTQGTLILK